VKSVSEFAPPDQRFVPPAGRDRRDASAKLYRREALTSNIQKDNPGLRLKDAEVWFPISYNRGLLWDRRHRGIKKTTLGHSATRAYNRHMIKWCYREVYAPLPEDWISAAVKEITFDPCLGHYGTLEDVLKHSLPAVAGPPGREVPMGEVVDLLAVLRAGEKRDVVRLHTPCAPAARRE
jgi:hypothetical protein